MIDESGFRHGVGIVLINNCRQVFLAKRIGMQAWQFPQGGMQENETPEETLFRELKEEVGLNQEDVQLLASTRRWLTYRLPARLIRHHTQPLCIGQKQKWFLLKHKDEASFDLAQSETPEFDEWSWVSYWQPLQHVVSFKRRVYLQVLKEFSRFAYPKRQSKGSTDLKR